MQVVQCGKICEMVDSYFITRKEQLLNHMHNLVPRKDFFSIEFFASRWIKHLSQGEQNLVKVSLNSSCHFYVQQRGDF